eukprot:TRINITY_DN2445_c0_g1_i1.p1 TRINITY_DN2445_c0_g1~~TRINITY_DN2445_c0_g1_i1.p1  ORF type:complete len:608 (-),score=116.12 TRINITY_DN2445_c0_g1_i1:61-1884(-)
MYGKLFVEEELEVRRYRPPWYDVKQWSKPSKIMAFIATVVLVCMSIIIVVIVAGPPPVKDGRTSEEIPDTSLFVKNGAVASDHPLCSQIGTSILKLDGHAVDAAIATAFCLGVVNPFASGIGGGGVMLVYNNVTKLVEVFDFREMAPSASTVNMYVSNPSLSLNGALAIAVPGELRGMYAAWSKYGTLPWNAIMSPAVDLANNGFPVGTRLAEELQNKQSIILSTPSFASVYAPNGKILKLGETCVNAKLGKTLQYFRDNGVEAFYTGEMGKTVANEIKAAGGILTFEDLNNYKVQVSPPTSTYYLGYKVFTSPAPFGGPVVGLALNLMERFILGSNQLQYGVDSLHLEIESFKFAYSDRMALGDPSFVKNISFILQQMNSKDHASVLRERISPSQTFPPNYYADLTDTLSQLNDSGTSHIAVVDGMSGNAVSFTTTINTSFGSKFVSDSTGILFNNEMDDFSSPNMTNFFGYPPSENNFIAPGKRPLSSMSPTIVFKDSEIYLVVGASGGSYIISATTDTIVRVLNFGFSLNDAIQKPRFHHQLIPNVLAVEEGFPAEIVEGLEKKGDDVLWFKKGGVTQGILVDKQTGGMIAVSDHRKYGLPYGY